MNRERETRPDEGAERSAGQAPDEPKPAPYPPTAKDDSIQPADEGKR